MAWDEDEARSERNYDSDRREARDRRLEAKGDELREAGSGVVVPITGSLLTMLQEFLRLGPSGTLSGADIAQRAKLSSGTIYPLLKMLEDAEWLTSEWENLPPQDAGRPRRRLYKITEAGIRQTRAAAQEIDRRSH